MSVYNMKTEKANYTGKGVSVDVDNYSVCYRFSYFIKYSETFETNESFNPTKQSKYLSKDLIDSIHRMVSDKMHVIKNNIRVISDISCS